MADEVITIRPLTPELWPAFEDLFNTKGPCSRCWCMYWRLGAAYHKQTPEENKTAFRQIVEHGPPPGLLALDGEKGIGWCQLTPRDALPWLDRQPRPRPIHPLTLAAVSL